MTDATESCGNCGATLSELQRIEKEGSEALAAIQQLIAFAQQKNADAKPVAVRNSNLRAA